MLIIFCSPTEGKHTTRRLPHMLAVSFIATTLTFFCAIPFNATLVIFCFLRPLLDAIPSLQFIHCNPCLLLIVNHMLSFSPMLLQIYLLLSHKVCLQQAHALTVCQRERERHIECFQSTWICMFKGRYVVPSHIMNECFKRRLVDHASHSVYRNRPTRYRQCFFSIVKSQYC